MTKEDFAGLFNDQHIVTVMKNFTIGGHEIKQGCQGIIAHGEIRFNDQMVELKVGGVKKSVWTVDEIQDHHGNFKKVY